MPEALVDVPIFVVKIVVDLWKFFLASGVFGAIFLFERLWRRGQISERAIAIALGICLIPTFYMAWHREYSALKDSNRSVSELRRENERLEAIVQAKCPPADIVAINSKIYSVSVGYSLRLSQGQTQQQFEVAASPIVAVKVFAVSGRFAYLDTGEQPGLYRSQKLSAGEHMWVCGPSIPKTIFRGAPDGAGEVQVTIYRRP